ncbi:MAG: hypothetical protein JWP09_344 [Candidatus Taylorbacteria bacterium]|nr:hypothetical protein [Candidatus Taylorbacteria bacterium]
MTKIETLKKKFARLNPASKVLVAVVVPVVLVFIIGQINFSSTVYLISDSSLASTGTTTETNGIIPKVVPTLDKVLYDKGMLALANIPLISKCTTTVATSTPKTATSTKLKTIKTCASVPAKSDWPTKTVYPNAGALLPFNRIVAYYGNFYSTKMGVLGEYPENVLIPKLQGEVQKWTAADPTTPVIPAVDYIVSTAQGSAGDDGKYRLRMPDAQIQKAIDLANKIGGIVFLDIQTGQSTFEAEIPLLKKYLELPNVHLALDPEFNMKPGQKPGTRIGSIDASNVNFAAQFLAKIVQDNNLTPKILVVHRFTEGMVTHTENIKPLPEVQVVMDMDGWGGPAHKKAAYNEVIDNYPVQFTGLKLFYKNDLRTPSPGMMTTSQVLNLSPKPSYIQYQ